MERIDLTCRIEKTAPDQRRFWGKAYIHHRGDGTQIVDHSGDVIDTTESQQELEEAFYKFVTDYRTGDMEHQVFNAATLIEGFCVSKEKKAAGIFPAEMDEGVYVAFQCDDSDEGDLLWEGVKSGRLNALSIVGTGEREAI